MKIALDMQSRQTTGSRERGIGRYSLSLAKAMLHQGQSHEFSILLNGVFDRTVEQVRADFDAAADDPRIQVYQTLPNSTEWTSEDAWRHKASEYLRESYLAAQGFDFVHCTSLFESPMDDSSTSWGQVANGALHGVTLYDLIPYAFPETYLAELPMRTSYLRKIQDLRKADLLLAISEYSRREAIDRLDIDPARVVNIAGAADDRFRRIEVTSAQRDKLLGRFGLGRFVMYTGGIDHR
jgi:glycosyltransferase involved in cell wall biosynthesis